VAARGASSGSPSAPLLQPYAWAGLAVPPPAGQELAVPAGGVVRARLGTRARVTLYGPARLSAAAPSADRLAIALGDGILIADYDHQSGGQLRIEGNGARVEVVGTLLAVSAHAGV